VLVTITLPNEREHLSMSLPYAPAAEQLKASHKDDYTIATFSDELRELAASTLGLWITHTHTHTHTYVSLGFVDATCVFCSYNI
jgi:hypothetical protein